MIPKPLAVFIVCAVTVVWLANFGASLVIAGYTTDGWVHTIFLSVVGGAMVASRKSGGSDKDAPDDPEPTVTDPAGAPHPPPKPDTPRPGGSHRAPFAVMPWRAAT